MADGDIKNTAVLCAVPPGFIRIFYCTSLIDQARATSTTVDAFKLYYLSKDGYAQVVAEVEAGGLDKAAEVFKVEKKTIISYLRYNGRGKFVAQKKEEVVSSKDWKGLDQEETVEYVTDVNGVEVEMATV